MSTITQNDLLSEYMNKEVIVSLNKKAFSTSFTGDVYFFKGVLINSNAKFITLMNKNKKNILINIDAIVTIEESK